MERGSNISSLQVQSQHDVTIVLKDSSTLDCIPVYAQKSLLLNNSAYFAAQLSERWADTCKKDESGRPILEIKECESPGDYERALKKVYENPARSDGEKPAYTFQTFEDAVGCLVPADHLGFSALLESAVNFLESVPWTDSQTQLLLKTVMRVNFADAKTAHKLTKRTKAQMEEVRAAILDKVLAKAVDSASTTEGRLFLEALIGRLSCKQESKPAAKEIAAGLKRTVFRLGAWQLKGLAPPMKLDKVSGRKAAYMPGLDFVDGSFENHSGLAKVVENLGWIFQLPMFPGQSEVMKEVVQVLIAIRNKWDSRLYTSQIFHRYLAKDLYLWVMTAVKEGRCILDTKLRLELLRMWVPKVRSIETYKELHSGEMQDAFYAVLSTVSRYDQEQVLHQWLDDLMSEDPWQPWFKEWLEANLVVDMQ